MLSLLFAAMCFSTRNAAAQLERLETLQTKQEADAPTDPPSHPSESASKLTVEECSAFGRKIEAVWNSRQLTKFSELFDWRRFSEIVLEGTSLNDFERAGFIYGFETSVSRSNGMLDQMLKAIVDDGTRFVRVRTIGHQKRVLIRIILANGGCNFHEFVLERKTGGRLHIVDSYVYYSGELLSKTVGRLSLPLVSTATTENTDSSQSIREGVQNGKMLLEFTQQLQAGRFDEAITAYRQLPERLRHDKGLMLGYIQCVQKTSEADYVAALQSFRERFPDDVSLDFILIDYHILKGDRRQAAESLRRVDAALGGDNYLRTLLGIQLSQLGETKEAKQLANDAVQAEPNLKSAHFLLLHLSLNEEDHVETLRRLKELRTRCQTEFEDLSTVPEFSKFVASPQYDEWLQFADVDG